MVSIVEVPLGAEHLNATGDVVEQGQIIARSYDPVVDYAAPVAGTIVHRRDGLFVIAGSAFVVPIVDDGEVDAFAFGSLADAEAFAAKVQRRLGEEGMALDVSVGDVLELRQMDVDAAVAEFESAWFYDDEESED